MAVLPFDAPDVNLESAGGKGANLARLVSAGFRVPRGFIIATDEYRAFVADNGIDPRIQAALSGVTADDPPSLDRASRLISAAFLSGILRPQTRAAIRRYYDAFGSPRVAVRSSATAEDLPDLSFAGQQDTFLNVQGVEAVLAAIVRCWSSLWTARAIGYRLRNAVPASEIALAVVVQEMVDSDRSGVLFTADPLTGLRNLSVIDATYGLGEALVSGQVEPDHYVVDSRTGRVLEKKLGAKKLRIRPRTGGGTDTVASESSQAQVLFEDEMRQVVSLGQKVQAEYGAPQDIEWAMRGSGLYLLQARPITSLFPVPRQSFDPLHVWFSFGAVQGLLGPMTPLGLDSVRLVIAGAARLFGLHPRYDQIEVLAVAGERLWVQIDGVMRNPLGARIYGNLLPMVEPGAGQILKALSGDPRLGVGRGTLHPITVLRILRFGLSMLPAALRAVFAPERAATDAYRGLEYFTSQAGFSGQGDPYERLAEAVTFLRDQSVVRAFELVMPRFLPLMVPGMASLGLLTRLSGQAGSRDHGVAPLALQVTRSLPDNVTTEMDLALWHTAQAIRSDPASLDRFLSSDDSALATAYLDGSLPEAARSALDDFMQRYGMRGVGEIDIGSPRWRERPEPIIQALQSYLQITDPELAPDVLFERGARAADDAVEQLAAAARSQPGGWLKERVVRAAARRVRALLGIREAPKYFAIRVMGLSRQELLAIGRGLFTERVIDSPDDLFFLNIAELDALSKKDPHDWKALVAARRRIFEREARRRLVPRVLLSDGCAFYEGLGASPPAGEAITGSPVSPGVVEGPVHIVFDPHQSRLVPGEILVCPGTDPSWTPLFMAAGGLITEVGGMMTHGSVVARELGIPAVVGVDRATTRLKDGQRIRLDGSAGTIELLP